MKKIDVRIECDGKVLAQGYLLDISNGGVGVGCEKKIRRGVVVEVVPEQDVLPSMKAKVVAAIEAKKKAYAYRLGLEFILRSKKLEKCLVGFMGVKEKRGAKRAHLNTYGI